MNKKIKHRLIALGLTIIFASCSSDYNEGIKKYDEKEYNKALSYLRKVENSNKNYDKAQNKIIEIDNILRQIEIEEFRQDSIANEEKAKQESIDRIASEKKDLEDTKAQLAREIESIKTFDGSKYRGDVKSIQTELVLFAAWANIINRAEKYKDAEINRLGKALKAKVIILQKSEYPKLRKSYGEFLRGLLWKEDIDVKIKGSGYTTLELVGGIFVTNKNKQDFQSTMTEILHLLRFKRVNYKWYSGEDGYTYYTIKTGQDGDLLAL